MRVCNLSSSSEGNCTYVEENGVRVLIDAGLSCLQIENKLKEIGVLPNTINAIFITHEHYDHIKGINIFASKYNVDLYANKLNWDILISKFDKVKDFHKKQITTSLNFKGLEILAQEVPHDAVYTNAYRINFKNNSMAIVTDVGAMNENILNFAKGCPLIYLESNHDLQMLKANPNYSASLKRRITSDHGHLSNIQSAKAMEFLILNGTRQLVLSHLSKQNNTPILAFDNAVHYLETKDIIEGKHVKIDVASTRTGHIFKMV